MAPPKKCLEQPVMLFDGRCLFCNSAVRFILWQESSPVLRFAALQSKGGRELMSSAGMNMVDMGKEDDFGSFVIIDTTGNAHTRFSAVLHMFDAMGGLWKWFGRFCWLFVPRFFGNFTYDIGWKYRYLVMGKSDTCVKPTKAMKLRLIENGETFD